MHILVGMCIYPLFLMSTSVEIDEGLFSDRNIALSVSVSCDVVYIMNDSKGHKG